MAIIPIGWGYSKMGLEGSLDSIEIIQPSHVIPIHYGAYLEDFDQFSIRCSAESPDLKI